MAWFKRPNKQFLWLGTESLLQTLGIGFLYATVLSLSGASLFFHLLIGGSTAAAALTGTYAIAIARFEDVAGPKPIISFLSIPLAVVVVGLWGAVAYGYGVNIQDYLGSLEGVLLTVGDAVEEYATDGVSNITSGGAISSTISIDQATISYLHVGFSCLAAFWVTVAPLLTSIAWPLGTKDDDGIAHPLWVQVRLTRQCAVFACISVLFACWCDPSAAGGGTSPDPHIRAFIRTADTDARLLQELISLSIKELYAGPDPPDRVAGCDPTDPAFPATILADIVTGASSGVSGLSKIDTDDLIADARAGTSFDFPSACCEVWRTEIFRRRSGDSVTENVERTGSDLTLGGSDNSTASSGAPEAEVLQSALRTTSNQKYVEIVSTHVLHWILPIMAILAIASLPTILSTNRLAASLLVWTVGWLLGPLVVVVTILPGAPVIAKAVVRLVVEKHVTECPPGPDREKDAEKESLVGNDIAAIKPGGAVDLRSLRVLNTVAACVHFAIFASALGYYLYFAAGVDEDDPEYEFAMDLPVRIIFASGRWTREDSEGRDLTRIAREASQTCLAGGSGFIVTGGCGGLEASHPVGPRQNFRFDEDLGDVKLPAAYFLIAFSGATALFHSLLWAMGDGYTTMVMNGRQVVRWIEYSLTSSIMVFVIASVVGVEDDLSLLMQVLGSVVTNTLGYAIDILYDKGLQGKGLKTVGPARVGLFVSASLPFLASWWQNLSVFDVLLGQIFRVEGVGECFEGLLFIQYLIWGMFVAYILFPLAVLVPQIILIFMPTTTGETLHHLFYWQEVFFVILSFVSKFYLLAVLYVSAAQGGDRNRD